ncbi:hypothetical protein ACFQS7_26185 [Dankookia sp. GCM10030260]|uniref:hypothetical protein n=1 Tax=Dankookia sp. GCM10030260 TaxID=3273390 RepID=UPI003621D7E6
MRDSSASADRGDQQSPADEKQAVAEQYAGNFMGTAAQQQHRHADLKTKIAAAAQPERPQIRLRLSEQKAKQPKCCNRAGYRQ